MTTTRVHVGDIGTKYWYKLQRDGEPYDPSDADTHTLIFSLPTTGTVEKDAEIEQVDDDWFLTYVADEDFHAAAGRMSIQPHLTFADGQEYHGDIKRIRDDGAELRIYKNIETGSPS